MWRAPGYRKSFHSQLQQQRVNQKILYTFAIFPLTRHVTVGDSPVGSIDLFLIKISLIVHVTILLHLLKPYKKDSNVPSTTTTPPPPPPMPLVRSCWHTGPFIKKSPKSPGRSGESEEWGRGTGMEAGKDCGLARRTKI